MIHKLTTEEMHRLTVEEFRESEKLPLTVVLDNVRSLNNIGSVFRTSDAFRVEHIALCGITATPPHREIHKTALGAEDSVEWSYHEDTVECVRRLKEQGYRVYAVEQVEGSILLGTQEGRLQLGAPSGAQPSRLHAGETPAHPDIPNVRYRGYIPHFENRGYQFITFRLYDSVPQELIEEWRLAITQENTSEQTSEECRRLHRLVDQYEDTGHGQCFLADSRVADVMRQALEHDDGKKYDLLSYCIMPNHVHVLVYVYEGVSLSSVMHSWRSYTAHEANKILGRVGEFWMKDYYDRYIRNADHYRAVVQYIEHNPEKVGLKDVSVKKAPLSPGFASGVGMVSMGTPSGTQASRLHAAGTAAHPEAGETPAHPVAVVFGNEIEGVQESVIEQCDGCLEIPQYGTKHSLNVSCAAAIVIWEMFRQMQESPAGA